MRLSEELARILSAAPSRRRRRSADRAPQEIVPSEDPRPADAGADRFDAARERLRGEIPPRDRD